MPASSVEVISKFTKINLSTTEVVFHYYYEGTGKPAVAFASNKAGDVNFTILGRAGYYMTKDSDNENWYTFTVKGSYGTFQLYEITAEQPAAGTASGNLIDSFGVNSVGQELYDTLISGKTYDMNGVLYKTLEEAQASLEEAKKVPVTSIKLTSDTKSMIVGDTFTIPTPEVLPSNATNKEVSYTSSNKEVATVNETTGAVTAKKAGTAVITVQAKDGSNVTAKLTITVKDKEVSVTPNALVTAITLNATKKTLTIGEKYSIVVKSVTPSNATNKEVSYSSDNKEVATVNTTTGVVTAKTAGTAVITVKAKDGSGTVAKVTITVKDVTVTAITLEATKKILTIGQKYTIKVKSVAPSNATNKAVSYTSNNTSVATVNKETGVVTAKAADGSGTYAKVTITVEKKALSKPKVTVKSGNTRKVSVEWSKVTNAEKYNVYVNGKKVATTSKTSYTYSNVTAGKTYKINVVAVPKDKTVYKNSAKSSSLTVKVLKKATGLTLRTNSKAKAEISWNKISDASGYQIVRSTKKTADYKEVTTVSSSILKIEDSSVKSGKTYYYRVRAYKVYNGKIVYGKYSKAIKIKVK